MTASLPPVVVVDTETTGLDPRQHEVYEIALIEADGTENRWWIEPDLARADPTALRIGHYYERAPLAVWGGKAWRRKREDNGWESTRPEEVAASVANRVFGKHLIGAVPSFDAAFLEVFLRRHKQSPAWHYHLIDVEALAVGYLAGRMAVSGDSIEPHAEAIGPPWDSSELTERLGIKVSDEDKHTALGDARWAKAIYDAVMNGA